MPRSLPPRRTLVVLLGSVVPALVFASTAPAQTGPIPTPIPKGDVRINLQPVATGMAAPIDLRAAPGGGNTLYITDQAGQVRVFQNGSLLSTPFMDVTSRLAPLNPNYDERGFLGFAFHPDFNAPAAPGFGKVYTYTSERVEGTADFTVPINPGTNFNNQGVVAEWSVSAANPAVVDPASRREILRYDDPQSNHNGGPFHFGPDRNLYVAIGDGGAANDVGNGHNPAIGNAQDMTRVMGKMLRIDPLGRNSANGRYGIPANNPFVGNTTGTLPEIYASGLRNPFRFSFAPNGDLLVADVGQLNLEELNRVTAGGNYGWRVKEGTYLFNTDGTIGANSPGSPAGLIDPILQYDHDEGIAIVGGFVYRGTRIPELQGKYVFGDFSRAFTSPTGRLFYADLATGEIKEFLLGDPDRPLGMFVKGMGEDASGELYLLASTTLGPAGSGGQVLLIVPEPSTLLGLGAFAGLMVLRRRRR